MCVILATDKKKVSKEFVKLAHDANPHGAGAAWLEKDRVRYIKGLGLAEMLELVPTLIPPYVLHFRIATVGGVQKKLTHPFVIRENSPLQEKGTARQVLFHNGHWNDWRETMLKNLTPRTKLTGLWSDSRAMAHLAFIHGMGFLDLLDEKVAVLNRKGIRLFGHTWSEVNGITVSNQIFLRSWDRSSLAFGCNSTQSSLPLKYIPLKGKKPRTQIGYTGVKSVNDALKGFEEDAAEELDFDNMTPEQTRQYFADKQALVDEYERQQQEDDELNDLDETKRLQQLRDLEQQQADDLALEQGAGLIGEPQAEFIPAETPDTESPAEG